ncbi:MAG: YciI family protein [Kofleriaceae bacterium]
MKFMMIVKATKEAEAGQLPTHDELVAMDKYTEELQKAGILLEFAGLTPSSKGARIRYEGKRCTVTDGPFAEAKELIAGYCILQVKSREEAIEWAKRAPFGTEIPGRSPPEVEVRQVMGPEDFAPGGGWSTEKLDP